MSFIYSELSVFWVVVSIFWVVFCIFWVVVFLFWLWHLKARPAAPHIEKPWGGKVRFSIRLWNRKPMICMMGDKKKKTSWLILTISWSWFHQWWWSQHGPNQDLMTDYLWWHLMTAVSEENIIMLVVVVIWRAVWR